jgi:hypothetical protein
VKWHKKWKSVQKCLHHLIKQCHKPTARNMWHIILILLGSFFFISHNSMSRTVQLNNILFISIATCSLSSQTEHPHGSVCSKQTEHFQILFSDLKCIVVIIFIIPTHQFVEWYYTLYMVRHMLAFPLCAPAIISSVLNQCIVLCAFLMVSSIFVLSILIFQVCGQIDTWCHGSCY